MVILGAAAEFWLGKPVIVNNTATYLARSARHNDSSTGFKLWVACKKDSDSNASGRSH